jgi:hypothetical protein
MSVPPPQMAPTSNSQVGAVNSQHHGIERDQGNESSGDDGSEYDPNSCDDNRSVVKRPRKYHPLVIFFSWGIQADCL